MGQRPVRSELLKREKDTWSVWSVPWDNNAVCTMDTRQVHTWLFERICQDLLILHILLIGEWIDKRVQETPNVDID